MSQKAATVIRGVPTWNPVHACAQDPVERAHRDRQLFAVLGRADRVDQRIDGRVGGSRQVVGARHRRGARMEEPVDLVAGRRRPRTRAPSRSCRNRNPPAAPAYCAESTCRIEASMPIARMFSTHGDIDADEAFVLDQDIRPSGVSPLSLTRRCPSRFQPASASSLRPAPSSLRSRPEPSDAGCVTASPKASGGSSAAERLEQRQFLRRRQPFGLVVGAFEAGVASAHRRRRRDCGWSIRSRSTARSPAARAASRKRSRRWLTAVACMDGRFSPGNSRLTTLPAATAGKS